jgi:hypothetical protein
MRLLTKIITSSVMAVLMDDIKSRIPMERVMGHLQDVNMTYLSHMKRAFSLSFRYGLSTLELIIHGFIPSLFIDAGKKAADSYERG